MTAEARPLNSVKNMIVKMNEIVLDMDEVESIEWKHDEGEAYSVRFHEKVERCLHASSTKIN